MEKFVEAGAQVLGISVNRSSTNKGFGERIGVSFPLLSDAEKQVSRQYGVLNFLGVASRTTFVVDKQGIIRQIMKGSDAVDPNKALGACSSLEPRKAEAGRR